jgi:hypothetical protein
VKEMLELAYSVGPFLIKTNLIIVALSLTFAFVVTKYRLKREEASKKILDSIFNGVILGFVIWKFSYPLLHPLRTIENPLAILYFSGGAIGTILGVLIAAIYLRYISKKHQINLLTLIDGVTVAVISFFLFFYGLQSLFIPFDTFINLSGFIISVLFLVIMFYKGTYPIKKKFILELILWWSISQIIISYIGGISFSFIGIFSTTQVIYITLSFLIIIIQFKNRN